MRKEIGYVIGHQGDNPIVRLLPSGKRLVVRSGHINVIDKSEAVLSLIEKGIQGAKRQCFNDLLAEIQEFYSEESSGESEDMVRLPETVARTRDQISLDPQEQEDEVPRSPMTPPSAMIHHPTPASLPQETTPETPLVIHEEPEQPTAPRPDNRTVVPPLTSEASPPRRSSRSGAQKPPGYYARLHSGDSVADYTACHLRASECARLYGEGPMKNAATTEVINMIKDRGAAKPQDYRKLSPRTIQEAVSSFMFFKAKDLLPSEAEKERDLVTDSSCDDTNATSWSVVKSKREKKLETSSKGVKIRGRWVGGGHQQQREESLAERIAPTARGATHNILMAIAAFEGRQLLVGDIPSAYLQADHVPANGKAVHIIADRYTTKLIVESMPEYTDFVRPNGTMILKVEKAMYGLVESAWLWYKELERHLVGIGYTVSSSDRGLFYKTVYRHGKLVASNIASVHVDDIISAASPNAEGKKLQDEFWGSMEKRWPGIKLQTGPKYKHLSWNISQDKATGEIRKSQRDYLNELVKEVGIEKERKLPCRSDILNGEPNSPKLSKKATNRFRSVLQKVAYARDGRPDFDFVVCYLQSKQSAPSEQDMADLEHLLGYIKRNPEKEVIFKPRDLQLRGATDASFNITQDARSYFGYVITLGGSLIAAKGGRIKTLVRSSTEAEISAVNEIASEVLWCRDLIEELGYEQGKIAIKEDNMSCITMLQKEPRSFHSKSRHVRVKWAFFRQEYAKRTLRLSYCAADKMVADLLTKPMGGKAHDNHTSAILEGREP